MRRLAVTFTFILILGESSSAGILSNLYLGKSGGQRQCMQLQADEKTYLQVPCDNDSSGTSSTDSASPDPSAHTDSAQSGDDCSSTIIGCEDKSADEDEEYTWDPGGSSTPGLGASMSAQIDADMRARASATAAQQQAQRLAATLAEHQATVEAIKFTTPSTDRMIASINAPFAEYTQHFSAYGALLSLIEKLTSPESIVAAPATSVRIGGVKIPDKASHFVTKILAATEMTSARISRAADTPMGQAQSMYNNAKDPRAGVASQRRLYGHIGDSALDVYEANVNFLPKDEVVKLMAQAIESGIQKAGPDRNEMQHIQSSSIVFDIAISSISHPDRFEAELKLEKERNPDLIRYFGPRTSDPKSFHIELKP